MEFWEYAVNEIFGEDQSVDESPLDDLHLNNAINLDHLKNILGIQINYKIHTPTYIFDDVLMLLKCRELAGKEIILGFQQITTSIAQCGLSEISINFKIANEVCKTLQVACKKYGLNFPITELPENILTDIKIPEQWWTNFECVLNIINGRSEIKRGAHNVKKIPIISCTGNIIRGPIIIQDNNYLMITSNHASAIYNLSTEENKIYLGNIDSILLLLDTLGQRLCLYLANQICAITRVPGTVPFAHLRTIIDIGDTCIQKLGNQAYDIIAMFEALCVSVILTKCPDKVNDSELFINSCKEEIETMFRPDTEEYSIANETTKSWIYIIQLLPITVISNVFCLYRIWGHPTVDIYSGMEKVYKLGTLEKFIPIRISETALHQFRKMFLLSFYKKHKVYPKIKVLTDDTNYVISCIEDNNQINTKDNKYHLSQFSDIQIEKIWEIPETYDIFHILNDKAVSPNRSELIRSIKNNKGTQCGELRRGLWRWLKSDSFRCKELLKKINESGLNEDSLIIGLYEKEREIKICARMFALMSEEMRYYFVLTEEMIANYILKYFPEITMKDSLNILLRKLWTHSKRTSENELDVNINIDFSKWNLNMRDELVNPVFKEMDRMFGYTDLISRTHDIFTNSFIYSASGKYIPKTYDDELISDEPMSYYGHVGGFEGLRQKGWTVVTVVILSYIADAIDTKISLMGQGDNQVVKIHMPRRRWKEFDLDQQQKILDAKDICEKYIEGMEVNFSSAQLPIKVRETWRSCNLFMYGKMMTLSSDTLPQWYKKILRSYALSNEGVVTFGGVIGTIASNLTTAASTSTDPDIMYIIYLVLGEWSCWSLLRYHPFTRKTYLTTPPKYVSLADGTRRRDHQIKNLNWNNVVATLLTIPTSVGGNITIPMTSYICRGFPDPGSEGYSWVKFLISGNGQFTNMYENWYGFLTNSTIELDHLVQSPLALNHKRPPTPEVQSREVVRNWLLNGQFKENKFIRNVEKIMNPFVRKEICKELVGDPCSPLIVSELYQILPQVALDSVLRRVENTRTIRRMALNSTNRVPVLKKLMEVEENFLAYICWRLNTPGEKYSNCATKQTRVARDIGWGRKIIHITTPHPLELLLEKRCETSVHGCHGEDYIFAKVKCEGEFAPYLGSRTKVKVFSNQDEYARREPLLSISSRLARYTGWLNLGPNIKKFIESTVRITCDIDIFDNFFAEDTATETFTGSIEHRFQPTGASDGSFINYAPQIGSKVFLSSDFLPTYGRGQTNYTLAFQPLYIYFQYVAAKETGSKSMHFHLSCPDCITPVEDVIPDMRSNCRYIEKALSSEYHNIIRETIGFIKEKIILTELNMPEIIGTKINIDNVSCKTIEDSLYTILGHSLALGLRTYTDNKSDTIGTEDLQSYPRIYSYKIFVDRLLSYIANSIIFQTILKNDLSYDSININTGKRCLIRNLTQLPKEAFKDIASLCVGRHISKDSNLMLISGAFPETVDTFLETIKNALIGSLEDIAYITLPPKKLVLPISILTKRLHLFILIGQCIDKGCHLHLSQKSIEECIGTENYPDCKNHCIQESLKHTLLTNATLDRMFKKLIVLSDAKQFPIPFVKMISAVEIPISTSINSMGVISTQVVEKFCRLKGSNRVLSRPTASIYKWENIKLPEQSKTCVIFGDGTGGSSLCIATNHPNVKFYPCAKLEKDRCIPQDILSITPSLSRQLSNISNELQIFLPDDILDNAWSNRFKACLQAWSPESTVIISDVEGIKGNKPILEKLIESLADGVTIFFKIYLHEYLSGGLGKGIRLCKIISNTFMNLKYGEVIITGIVDRSIQGGRDESINEGIKRLICNIDQTQDTMKIHNGLINKYISVWRYNLIWAVNSMNFLGIPITLEIISLRMFEVIGYVLTYIDNHYFFGGNKIKEGSHHITPRRQEQLCSEIRILIAVYLSDYINQERLFGIRLQPEITTRLPILKFTHSRLNFQKSETDIILILKMHRARIGLSELHTNDLVTDLRKQIEYAKGHRTYTWALSNQQATSLNLLSSSERELPNM